MNVKCKHALSIYSHNFKQNLLVAKHESCKMKIAVTRLHNTTVDLEEDSDFCLDNQDGPVLVGKYVPRLHNQYGDGSQQESCRTEQ